MENLNLSRRDLLGLTAGLAISHLAGTVMAAPAAGDVTKKPLKIRKAVKIGMIAGELKNLPLQEKLKRVKEIGYDGVELNSPNDFTTGEVKEAVQNSGLPVHGVVDSVHWRQTLSDPDPAVRQQGVEALQTALRDAKDYGATSVLLVPAVVSEKISYADAYERSQAEIRKAVPLAEELGVPILFENVWNNFLLSPLETARYIDEFGSDMVGSYFDIGNVVRYGWPEHWIAALGPRIRKLDVKGYSRKKQMAEGPWKGFDVQIDEGDIDWAAVRDGLRNIGYTDGWATAEVPGGGEERLAQILKQMQNAFDA